MIYKIALGGDLHKRPKDITTIKGYVDGAVSTQRKIMRTCVEKEFDAFISIGDWYDKGYVSDISASLADIDIDIQMKNLLKGNFYGLIGNHIRLNMDSNPELHAIQPHPVYKSRRAVLREEQIIKTPDILRYNDVQISFMHHEMNAINVLDYKPTRQPWAKYHIALFHTPWIIPNAHLIRTNLSQNVYTNSQIGETLEGVDLAICGDIHVPLGQFTVNTPTGSTIMVVPGSLTNTDASERFRHHSIMMPIVTIEEDSTVKLEYLQFDLQTNLLTFKDLTLVENREKLKSLRGNAIKSLYEASDVVAVLGREENSCNTLNSFMAAQRYTDADRAIVKLVINDAANIDKLIELFTEDSL